MGISIKIKNKMKYLKLYEDIDPFEEDWDEEEFDVSKNEEDYWIVKKMGDDRIYFTKRIKIPLKRYKQFYDYRYQVLERDYDENCVFTNRYTINNQSIVLLSRMEMNNILNDKEEVSYLDTYVRYRKLSEICKFLKVNKNHIKFKHR